MPGIIFLTPATLNFGSDGLRPSGEPGRKSKLALSPISLRRASLYLADSIVFIGTSLKSGSAYHASRSA